MKYKKLVAINDIYILVCSQQKMTFAVIYMTAVR